MTGSAHAAGAITNVVTPPYRPEPAPGTTPAELLLADTNQLSRAANRTSPLVLGADDGSGRSQARRAREMELTPTGAAARYGPHSVEFEANLRTTNALRLHMSNGQQLTSRIIGLAYYTSDGKSILIAEPKDCVGEILSESQIIYRNAFDDVSADVLYTYTETSLEQDVVIRKRLPKPEKFSMDPALTKLVVISEFLDSPTPVRLPAPVDLSSRNRTAHVVGEDTLPDELLVFETMRIGPGKAFSLGNSTNEVPTGKRWTRLDGRDVLLESTPYLLLKAQLEALPETARLTPGKAGRSLRTALLDNPRPAASPKLHSALRTPNSTLALALASQPGVVLDYLISTSPLLNINFGNVTTNKVGYAVAGQTATDYWNGYQFPGQSSITLTNLKWSDGNNAGIDLTVLNAPSQSGNPVSDGMYNTYSYSASTAITITLTNVASGIYDFYCYGHGASNDQNGIFQLSSGANSYGTQSTTTSGSASWNSTAWQEGVQYVLFRGVTVASNQVITLTVQRDSPGYAIINGLQLVPNNPQSTIASLMDLNFGDTNDLKVGTAAVGLTTNDSWNNVDSKFISSPVTVANLKWSDAVASPVSVTISNAPGLWNNPVGDGMYGTYAYSDNGQLSVTLSNLANGRYDFYLYGHGAADNQNGSYGLVSGPKDYGTKANTTSGSASWNSTAWTEGQQYVVFRSVWVTNGQNVVITGQIDGAGYAMINGMQIVLPQVSDDTDSDGDGLPDVLEAQLGTNPHKTDTDGDGVSDYLEYIQGRNPKVAGANVDTTGITGLKVYTPLK